MPSRSKQRVLIEPSHFSFSDESGTDSKSSFASICSVSTTTLQNRYNSHVSTIVEKAGLSEFKFTSLNSIKKFLAAKELLDFVKLVEGNLRVKVIIWDKSDSRHSGVIGIDHVANTERMYWHLHKNVILDSWSDVRNYSETSKWCLVCDKDSKMNLPQLKKIFNNEFYKHSEFNGYYRHLFSKVVGIQEECSKACNLIQLADLFAGLACFQKKYESGDFLESSSNKFKVQLLKYFETVFPNCKYKSKGRYVNIWNYKAQSSFDKAPTRK